MQRGAPIQPRKDTDENEHKFLMALASGQPSAVDNAMTPKALERELDWLKDPRALADRVGRLIHAGEVASAATLVRQANKEGMPTTAAWNRLIQHCMERLQWKPAFKFFNDVSLSLDLHGLHETSESSVS